MSGGARWRRRLRARLERWLRPVLARRLARAETGERQVLRLETVRRRLELLLAATFGRPVPVEPIPPPRQGLLRRLAALLSTRGDRLPKAQADDARVRLPATLEAAAGLDDALGRYRLMALRQGARVVRGSALHLPPRTDRVVRDLYLAREAAACEALLLRELPGLADRLAASREEALARRPHEHVLHPMERAVDRHVRLALAAPPDDALIDHSPERSLRWAEEEGRRIRALGGPYRMLGIPTEWGTLVASTGAPTEVSHASPVDRAPTVGVGSQPTRRGGAHEEEAADEEGDTHAPSPQARSNPTRIADARGIVSERGAPDPRHGAVGGPSAAALRLDPDDESSRVVEDAIATPILARHRYDEWDCDAGRHRAGAVTLRVLQAPEGDAAWADATLARHGALVRRVRERFERLRARRLRLSRQRDGDELDLAACVRLLVDRRRGDGGDDRLHVAVRPARRGLAILLLVDTSGSTDLPVSDEKRIVDVAKEAVLLAGAAFDALGDRWAVLTFASRGASDVRVTTIREFDEQDAARVRRRVAAIEPKGNTRLGAAIRHATRRLAAEPAGHRLLLVVSDGKPNDGDGYFDRYAIEDARQSVHEARAHGVVPFCLTVDAEEPEAYLGHVFGAAGHAILRDPEQLPSALLTVVRRMLS